MVYTCTWWAEVNDTETTSSTKADKNTIKGHNIQRHIWSEDDLVLQDSRDA